jgi:hypothetical protein
VELFDAEFISPKFHWLADTEPELISDKLVKHVDAPKQDDCDENEAAGTGLKFTGRVAVDWHPLSDVVVKETNEIEFPVKVKHGFCEDEESIVPFGSLNIQSYFTIDPVGIAD